jgi:adenosylmethionine-8-amino-7-oxononanoate aminotransferase
MPLAAVLATQAIYDGFLDDSRERAFLHSHSYTGNPIACAAALASLSIFDEEDWLGRNRRTSAAMAERAAPLRAHPEVVDVRQTGMILAIEMAPTPPGTPQRDARGLRAYRHALDRGVLLRPLGDVLYWMPPYCIGDDALDLLADVTRGAIDAATGAAACA